MNTANAAQKTPAKNISPFEAGYQAVKEAGFNGVGPDALSKFLEAYETAKFAALPKNRIEAGVNAAISFIERYPGLMRTGAIPWRNAFRYALATIESAFYEVSPQSVVAALRGKLPQGTLTEGVIILAFYRALCEAGFRIIDDRG